MEFFARFDDASISAIAQAGHEVAMPSATVPAFRVWVAARVDGFVDASGAGHFDNTGMIVIDGSGGRGLAAGELDGVTHFEGVRFYAEAFEAGRVAARAGSAEDDRPGAVQQDPVLGEQPAPPR